MCSYLKFSVGDSLELSGIQFTPPKRSGRDTDKTVSSCLALRCELAATRPRCCSPRVLVLQKWSGIRCTSSTTVLLTLGQVPGGSVAEWLACWTHAQKGRVQIAAATLSGNSLRQTVHTHRASVRQAAKLAAALLRVARVTACWRKVMTAYRRVYVSRRHLHADCQEPGSDPEPYARQSRWATGTFYPSATARFLNAFHPIQVIAVGSTRRLSTQWTYSSRQKDTDG